MRQASYGAGGTGGHGGGARPRSGRRGRSSRRAHPLLLAVALALTLSAGVALALGLSRQEPPPPAGAAAPPAPPPAPQGQGSGQTPEQDGGAAATAPEDTGSAEETGLSGVEPLGASPPQRIDIPKLRVSTSLVNLGLDANRAMETPQGPDRAGWYEPGPSPGAKGPAVIAAHVTWDRKPAVFFRLSELSRGDTVEVARQDGRTAVFTVSKIATYPKDEFPTVEVYGNVDHAGLRLITCGGEFSSSTNRYSDNVVVYAKLTGTK